MKTAVKKAEPQEAVKEAVVKVNHQTIIEKEVEHLENLQRKSERAISKVLEAVYPAIDILKKEWTDRLDGVDTCGRCTGCQNNSDRVGVEIRDGIYLTQHPCYSTDSFWIAVEDEYSYGKTWRVVMGATGSDKKYDYERRNKKEFDNWTVAQKVIEFAEGVVRLLKKQQKEEAKVVETVKKSLEKMLTTL